MDSGRHSESERAGETVGISEIPERVSEERGELAIVGREGGRVGFSCLPPRCNRSSGRWSLGRLVGFGCLALLECQRYQGEGTEERTDVSPIQGLSVSCRNVFTSLSTK